MATKSNLLELIRHRLSMGWFSPPAVARLRNRLFGSAEPSPSIPPPLTRVSQRYRLLFENLEYVVFSVGVDGVITFISPAIERHSGYKVAEVEGQPFASFVFPDDLPDLHASFERTCAGQLQPHDFRTISKDGSIRWVRSSSCASFDEAGTVLELSGIFADITEQRRMEDELRRSKASLEQAGRMAQLGAWDIEIVNREDFTANPLRWSNEVHRIFGYEPGDVNVSSRLFIERVHPEDRERVLDVFARTVKDEIPCSLEHRIITPSGDERTVLQHARLMRDEHTRVNRIVGALQDITERKLAETALIRSEKLATVGRMAATIAHEINNPLAAVMNCLFLVREDKALPLPLKQYLDLADEELRRISHITQQALGFYRESCEPTKVSLDVIVDSAIDLLKSKIKSKQVKLDKQYGSVLEVVGISGELRQVFSNLLVNSLDAIEGHGRVTMRISPASWTKNGRSWVRVTIADNGKGIPPTALPHVFEPLFTTKGAIGTGLGLWVTKEIIEKHAGSVRVRSHTNGPRKGTTVSVILPRS